MAYILEGRELPANVEDTTTTPCIFCGRAIHHFNGGGTGMYLGAVVDGQTRHFAYCHDPPCPQIDADAKYEHSIWSCECVGGGYVENVGETCVECRRTRENRVRAPDDIKKWRVAMTGLARMRGVITVESFTDTDAGCIAKEKSGDVLWDYEGMEDDTIEVDDIKEVQ